MFHLLSPQRRTAAVSRETVPGSPRSRLLTRLASLALAGAALAACTRAPAPQGWAPARAVTVSGKQLTVAAHRATLFALPQDTTTAVWQFPPKDKNSYPVSQAGARALSDAVDRLSVSSDQKGTLKQKVGQLNVSGPSSGDLKTAISNSGASSSEQSALKTQVDAVTKANSDALSSLQAFYGDLSVSSDSSTLYATAFKGYVYALDPANGHMRWFQKVGSEMIGGVALSTDGATAYYGTNGKDIIAVDAATGAVRWQLAAAGEIWSTPVVAKGNIYVTSLDGTVYALEGSGKVAWTFKNANAGIAGSPAISGDTLYVVAFDNRLYAVNLADGKEKWRTSGNNWFWGTPVVRDGVVYAANLDGRVYAVDAASGSAKWQKPFDTGSPVRSAPIIAGGGLIVANRKGEVYKLNLSSGQASGPPYVSGATIYANLTPAAGSDEVHVLPQSAQLIVLNTAPDQLAVSRTYSLAQ